ncbi:MAG: DNA polymerase/3'-5' exonuclease PolX [Deltaproteobacteria bacterium]|nr:MAG: DNA polymerase/3'-5' exonuclease PolX [Deltaproteobacteria bacterium]
MENKEIAKILEELALLLEIKGENVFKVRAYQNAARTLYSLTKPVRKIIEEGKLESIKGIGKSLASQIKEMVETGDLKFYRELKQSVPEGLFEMLKIPGLGPKKAKVLYEKLGISSIGELEYACVENRLVKLKGFGAKTQDKIIEGIQYIKKFQGHYLINEAWEQAALLKDWLEENTDDVSIEVAGSLRRFKEIVKDVDILAGASDPEHVVKEFVAFPGVSKVTASGNTKASVILEQGMAADLRVVSKEQFPHALQHFTGSKEHNVGLRQLAKKKGLKINEYGVFRNGDQILCKDEAEIYRLLNLDYIPPELREGMGEIEAASEHRIPKLVELNDIKGIIHVHTTYSDGKYSLEDMVKYVKSQGFEYIGISEHSQTAGYAGGLKPDDLKRQKDEIEELRKKYPGFGILWGIESDILPDGSLDYPDEILAQFDFVIGSVHSGFSNDLDKMMQRLTTALRNPFLTILGHPTGRLLLGRPSYAVDMKMLIDVAREEGKVIELNANPHRLDIDWRYCPYAKENGVKVCIAPDAHSQEGIHDIYWGVHCARKGWLEKNDVINCMSLNEILDFFNAKRAS